MNSLIAAAEQYKTRGRHRSSLYLQFFDMPPKLKFLILLGLLSASILLPPAFAQTELQNLTPFQAGLLAYQNKNYEEAKNQFLAAWEARPADAAALTNLGLASFQLDQKFWAIAYFRKALSIEPGYFPAKSALNYVFSQLEVKDIPHQLENYEFIRDLLLVPVSYYSYFWFLAIVVLLFGWSSLRFFGARRRALKEELPLPSFPWLSLGSGILMLVIAGLSVMKIYDLQIPRATVVEEKVTAQSAPGEEQVKLFDIYGGFEVILRDHKGDWVQVTYPGAMTGWIKKETVFVTSGGSPW